MRIASALVLATALQLACGAASDPALAQQRVALKALAEQLSQSWPPPSNDIRMTITWEPGNLLHCRIVNTSSRTIDLNDSALPWYPPNLMLVTVLNAEGKVVFSNRNTVFNVLMSPPRLRILNPGEALEGDIVFPGFDYEARAREDLLVIWSRQIDLYTGPRFSGVGLPASGITFLPKHEQRD
jgi:hypothetical protein